MGIKNPNIKIHELLKDGVSHTEMTQASEEIKEMIKNYLYVIIVTHGPNCLYTAGNFGYEFYLEAIGKKVGFLEGFELNIEQKEE